VKTSGSAAQPCAKNFSSARNPAMGYYYAAVGTILSSSIHICVTDGPDHFTVFYVQAWLPQNENTQWKKRSGE
jgi:hypothetical protein